MASKLKDLEPQEAEDKMTWLIHHAGFELDTAQLCGLSQVGSFGVDAKVIEKLQEIGRVSRELAKHYEAAEPRVEWEV